jgi:hypothetical protein
MRAPDTEQLHPQRMQPHKLWARRYGSLTRRDDDREQQTEPMIADLHRPRRVRVPALVATRVHLEIDLTGIQGFAHLEACPQSSVAGREAADKRTTRIETGIAAAARAEKEMNTHATD